MLTRLEADSIGTMEVPAKAYYGVQSLRAKHNFNITAVSYRHLDVYKRQEQRLSAESIQLRPKQSVRC